MIGHPLIVEWFARAACSTRVSRRAWVAGTFAGLVGVPLATQLAFCSQGDGEDDDAKETAQVKALGAKAGLAPFFLAKPTKHFLALGDADAEHCRRSDEQ